MRKRFCWVFYFFQFVFNQIKSIFYTALHIFSSYSSIKILQHIKNVFRGFLNRLTGPGKINLSITKKGKIDINVQIFMIPPPLIYFLYSSLYIRSKVLNFQNLSQKQTISIKITIKIINLCNFLLLYNTGSTYCILAGTCTYFCLIYNP